MIFNMRNGACWILLDSDGCGSDSEFISGSGFTSTINTSNRTLLHEWLNDQNDLKSIWFTVLVSAVTYLCQFPIKPVYFTIWRILLKLVSETYRSLLNTVINGRNHIKINYHSWTLFITSPVHIRIAFSHNDLWWPPIL